MQLSFVGSEGCGELAELKSQQIATLNYWGKINQC